MRYTKNQERGNMLPGVYQTTKKDGTIYYRASIYYHHRHISLGSASKAGAAHAMYLEAARLTSDDTITIHNYMSYIDLLSFEKAICILNFRDHGMYIKTPIYLQKSHFLYFLDPEESLKFDIDDLFYYSEHKIIRRKGHLFVNDYGMQYNIAARYGIKNFAVAGRDYQFVNGDSTDYRYSNIKIINRYHGVTQAKNKQRTWYVARLHLNGNVIVGKYTSEVKAAVAYNKAVDYAKSHGFTKNFIQNYLTELSPKEYADLYTRIRLSDKFLTYIDTHAPKE